MGLISQVTLKIAAIVTTEINSGQALGLFQGLRSNSDKIPKQVRNDIIAIFLRCKLISPQIIYSNKPLILSRISCGSISLVILFISCAI